MDYSLDLQSDKLFWDQEVFPECFLPVTRDDEPKDVFKDQQAGLSGHTLISADDDAFPDWLDLKMDLSLLEGLEMVSGAGLDDLLLGEVTNGQSLDFLSSLQEEDKALTLLDLEHLSYQEDESLSDGSIHQSPTTTTTAMEEEDFPSRCLDIVSTPPQTPPPPSSPEWLVPDVGNSLESPPASVGSESCCSLLSPTDTAAVLTFVAPTTVHPISIVDTTAVRLDSQAISVNGIVGLSVLVVDKASLSPAPVEVKVKPKRERKRKADSCSSVKTTSKALKKCGDFSTPPTKKERKRKQNKDAAMRYRMKKRFETDTLGDEEGQLLKENERLKQRAQQLATELGYLKNLMREMFKAKGLLKT